MRFFPGLSKRLRGRRSADLHRTVCHLQHKYPQMLIVHINGCKMFCCANLLRCVLSFPPVKKKHSLSGPIKASGINVNLPEYLVWRAVLNRNITRREADRDRETFAPKSLKTTGAPSLKWTKTCFMVSLEGNVFCKALCYCSISVALECYNMENIWKSSGLYKKKTKNMVALMMMRICTSRGHLSDKKGQSSFAEMGFTLV